MQFRNKISWQIAFLQCLFTHNTLHRSGKIGAVYMIPGGLSHLREFAPVPFLGSVFVDVMPSKTVMLGRLAPAREFTPVAAPEWKFRLQVNAFGIEKPKYYVRLLPENSVELLALRKVLQKQHCSTVVLISLVFRVCLYPHQFSLLTLVLTPTNS